MRQEKKTHDGSKGHDGKSHEKTHEVFSIRIPLEMLNRLNDAVERDGNNRNKIIMDAISRHLEFLRVVAEQSAELVASLSGEQLKEIAADKVLSDAAKAALKKVWDEEDQPPDVPSDATSDAAASGAEELKGSDGRDAEEETQDSPEVELVKFVNVREAGKTQ